MTYSSQIVLKMLAVRFLNYQFQANAIQPRHEQASPWTNLRKPDRKADGRSTLGLTTDICGEEALQ